MYQVEVQNKTKQKWKDKTREGSGQMTPSILKLMHYIPTNLQIVIQVLSLQWEMEAFFHVT